VGKLRFIGGTRTIMATGQWGNLPSGWDVEFAANPGESLTIETGFKARNITVSSGNLSTFNSDFRPDGGTAGTGSITVKNGGALYFFNNAINIKRVASAGASSHFGSFTVENGGLLLFAGNPVIGVSNYNFAGTVVYNGFNQTLASKGGNTGGVDISDYQDLIIGGSEGAKMLAVSTTTQNLNIGSGVILEVPPALNLTVTGTLTNNAGTSGLIIQEGGSLIHNTQVPGTMKWNPPSNNWQFLSAPVFGMTILGSDFAPNSNPLPTNFDFYAFNESVTDNLPWINLRAADGNVNAGFEATFLSGKGYLVAYSGDYPAGPYAFEGPLLESGVGVTLAYTADNDWAGWNLIGNPYPSGYNWGAADKASLADAHAYIYVGAADNYVYQEGGSLAPNQGFFVLADGAGEFIFDRSLRVHGGTYTKSNDAPEALVLQLSNATHADQTTIRILEGTEFIRDFRDAIKMFSFAAHMPQIYSYTSDQRLVAINSVPHISEEVEFTLGMRIPATGQYTLSVNDISGVFSSGDLYLQDLSTGAVHNLGQNPEYGFMAEQGDDPARFLITFAQPTNVPVIGESLVNIYTWGRTLYVNFSEEDSNRLLQVFDLSGRLVMSHKLNYGLNHTQQLSVEQGVYIVRISSPAGIATQRVFIK
jgi:hypothetical protein